MSAALDEIEAIAREATRINHNFHQIAREAYQFARKNHADPKYNAFRDSDLGRSWKQRKLAECDRYCPECRKPINENNSDIDHKHPRRHYPWLAWDVDNLWVLCKECNQNKGDKQWEEYLNAVKLYRGQAAVNRILKHAPPATLSGK